MGQRENRQKLLSFKACLVAIACSESSLGTRKNLVRTYILYFNDHRYASSGQSQKNGTKEQERQGIKFGKKSRRESGRSGVGAGDE